MGTRDENKTVIKTNPDNRIIIHALFRLYLTQSSLWAVSWSQIFCSSSFLKCCCLGTASDASSREVEVFSHKPGCLSGIDVRLVFIHFYMPGVPRVSMADSSVAL